MKASLSVNFWESYDIKKYLEFFGVDISEQEIIELEELEDETSISVVF